jgi:hypothetical protein
MMRRSIKAPVALMAVAIVLAASACGSDSSSATEPVQPSDGTSLVAKNVAQAAGLATKTYTHGENCVADFDGDGKLDVLLSTHDSTSAPPAWPLMLGVGDGKFVRDQKFQLDVRDRHGCAVADFNQDGLLDVYMSIGGCIGTCQAPKELWIQQPDHTFVNEAAQWGISDPSARGRVPVALNVNGDKLPDLFTGAEKGIDFPSYSRIWINKGDHFEEVPPKTSTGNLCAAAADIDGDGYDDLAVCTPSDGIIVFRNEKGKLVGDTKSFGLDDYGRRAIVFGDVNGDGKPDFGSVAQSRVQIYLNENGRYGDPTFDVAVTDGMDMAFGDVDADGDLDVYVQQGAKPPGTLKPRTPTNTALSTTTTTTRPPADAPPPPPDQIFLNDGKGHFTPSVKLPRNGGQGDTVVPIPDWKGTGRAAFLVNNGFQFKAGARQLFEFSKG